MSTSQLDHVAVRPTADLDAEPAEPAGRSMAGLREERGRQRSRIAAGRPEAVARQHGLGKLTARERLGLLLDVGSLVEAAVLRDKRAEVPRRKHGNAPLQGSGLF